MESNSNIDGVSLKSSIKRKSSKVSNKTDCTIDFGTEINDASIYRISFSKSVSETPFEKIPVSDRIKHQLSFLKERFQSRTQRIKNHIRVNLDDESDAETPDSSRISLKTAKPTATTSKGPIEQIQSTHRLSLQIASQFDDSKASPLHKKLVTFLRHTQLIGPIRQQMASYLIWLSIVSTAYLYNLFSITLRFAFEFHKTRQNNTITYTSEFKYFLIADYVSDIIYLIDMFWVKTRICFIDTNGLWAFDSKLMALSYFKSFNLLVDALSIVPLDLIQIIIGWNELLRVNRLIKINSLWEFYDRWDRYIQSGFVYLIRFTRLLMYLILVIHFYACAYYKFSTWEHESNGVANAWVYNSDEIPINAYVYSFLFALKLASTIGNNPKPVTRDEYLFTSISYIVAIFVFALLVDQIRGIVRSLTEKQDEYLINLDKTLTYLKNMNVSADMELKVRQWFDYIGNQQEESAIELDSLSFLPKNIQTDLAIKVHFDLLSKVQLFQDCDRNLLYSLVLKIKPIVFMPGDYICKKGDVGREMYIVDKGVIEVLVMGRAVAQLNKGSVFGEISLLSVGTDGNRRTADVVSKGFSTLYVLHKNDLNEVLRDYPEVEKLLRKKARKILNQSVKRKQRETLVTDHIINGYRKKITPGIISTILASMKNNSKLSKLLFEANQLKKQQAIDRLDGLCASDGDDNVFINDPDNLTTTGDISINDESIFTDGNGTTEKILLDKLDYFSKVLFSINKVEPLCKESLYEYDFEKTMKFNELPQHEQLDL